MKQIAILGSTGSIGTQALQVIEEHPDQYEAYVLTANNRVEELIAQARRFKPEAVVIANESKYTQLKEALADLPIKVYAGADALCQIVTENPIDMVLTAMVGYAGLKPTMNAIRARKPIALANKETLVVAGELINDLAQEGRTMILVTHELQFAQAIADRIIFLDQGKIAEEGSAHSFFTNPQTQRAQEFLNVFDFSQFGSYL